MLYSLVPYTPAGMACFSGSLVLV